MYPLNDKDLDRLSRDAAEHFDVESSASGWERLESKLNKELPVKEKDRRRFLFWLFLIALVSGGSLVYMLGGAPGDNNDLRASNAPEIGNVGKTPAASVPTEEGNKEVVAKSKTGSEAKNKVDASTNNDNETVTKSNIDPQKNDDVDGVKKDDAPANANDVATKSKSQTPKTALRNKTTGNPVASTDKKTNLQNNPVQKNKPVPADQSRRNKAQLTDKPKTKDQPDRAIAKADKEDAGKEVITNDSQKTEVPVTKNDVAGIDKVVAETDKKVPDTETKIDPIAREKHEAAQKADEPQNVVEQAAAKKPQVKKNDNPVSRWEFGVVTGPDFNNVEFKRTYKAGLNIGAYIGYRISDRWLVNTGLVYTKKFYKVSEDDFYPPKHSYVSYLDIDYLTGSCSMFEIPVNVRYDISYNKKGRFFASTGISSYIMDKQDYDCYYWNNMGEYKKFPWKTDSNYNYIFSNLNLSFGYERALGKNFSIQAEPYLKLPLKGLGYGSIKMNSYGMFVTLKYKPSARLKK